MAVKVRVEQSPLKVRVGQADAIKILSTSPIGSSTVKNVSGGTADVTALNVTGVSTFVGNIKPNGNIIGDNATNISGINSVTATSFFGDGSGLTNAGGAILNAASGSQRLVLTSLTSDVMTSAATDADLSFNAASNLLSVGNLNITGISTFTGDMTIANGSGVIEDAGGQLKIRANTFNFKDKGNIRQMLLITQLGGARLYHNGNQKFETVNNGVDVTGTLTADLIDGGSF
tara:strand:+ start:461 stop:1153 length:693 start_codon:yes stop_codon:yes gene_type:complete